jgi:hypothetical protein
MRALLLLILIVIVVGAGLKMAGVPVPFIDYSVGGFGQGHGPNFGNVTIEAPGFNNPGAFGQ